MPQRDRPLDNSIEIITPENIAFHYRVAGPFPRLQAYAIDTAIRLLIMLSLLLIGSPMSDALAGAWLAVVLVTWFLLEWFYGALFETYLNGQTPGKRLMSLRVLSIDGQPIDGLQAVLRNILRAADEMPWLMLSGWSASPAAAIPLSAAGVLCMTLTSRFQRLGDVACGTMVVFEERSWLRGIVRVDEPRVRQMALELPVDFLPTRSLQKAVAAYVERRRYFSGPRRRELSRRVGEALVRHLHWPEDTDHDLLLCAIYLRACYGSDGRPPRESSHVSRPETLANAPQEVAP